MWSVTVVVLMAVTVLRHLLKEVMWKNVIGVRACVCC